MWPIIKENRKLIQFLLTCLVGYLLWVILYDSWIGPDEHLDFWLSATEAKEASTLLQWIGYPVTEMTEQRYKHAFLYNGHRVIGLASACNGLILFPLFSCFILATQGHWKRKIIYIIIGCFLIYHVNMIRIIGLILLKLHHPEWLDFNHKYTFIIIVYSFIFYLWYLWINYFSFAQLKSNEK